MKQFALAVVIVCLGGCGFHLRSFDLESNVDSYALVGDTRIGVVGPLRQGFRQASVIEAPADEAAVVIELLDQQNTRRSISTEGQARAAEYEVTYAVQYRLLDTQGDEIAPATWVRRERVFRIDRDNIVGSSEEQRILERELVQDVVGQMIRAIDTVTRQTAVSEVDGQPVPSGSG